MNDKVLQIGLETSNITVEAGNGSPIMAVATEPEIEADSYDFCLDRPLVSHMECDSNTIIVTNEQSQIDFTMFYV
ncbi:unnamed protein product [Clavelina lepadiformis]|uniref:Uncharacterized protein n=1 Tax=Clavelina lepadiformis TaxID=159417 RepID=A0ABP0FTL8_CLALP